jgi:hypothetical protein
MRTEPICLFNISNFPSIVEDELAVLQQRAAAQITTETQITFTFCVGLFLSKIIINCIIFPFF